MSFWKNSQEARDLSTEYATRKDFQKIFTDDMADLHLLAFLLTADQDKAEECFVSGLEDTIDGNPVFREWARSWSKRAIIKNAIKALAPAPGMEPEVKEDSQAWSVEAEENALISAVTDLCPLDRFVFVMSVLEGYSVHECSALLGQPVQEVTAAKSRALQHMGSLDTTVTPRLRAAWISLLASGAQALLALVAGVAGVAMTRAALENPLTGTSWSAGLRFALATLPTIYRIA
ncbi:MAG TPA: sigma factor-like helix-turn-helix DNA-binding protein [Candidatus Angelobacter sp.]|nr:sigma factor-like helix-turn-helix DNA-binding protein [Candidatus Angelobacter sp.]